MTFTRSPCLRLVVPLIWALLTGAAWGAVTDDLAQRVQARLKKELPQTAIKIAGALELSLVLAGGETASVYLKNLALACECNPAGCDKEIAQLVAAVKQGLVQGRPAPAAVRAVLKSREYVNESRRQALATGRANNLSPAQMVDAQLVSRPFVGDLVVIYVLDKPSGMQMISQGTLSELRLGADELHALAVKNLDAALPAIEYKPVRKIPGLFFVEAGDSYETSRLLLHKRWEKIAKEFGGNLAVGVPARDVVVFANGSNAEHLAKLRQVVGNLFNNDDLPVSAALYKWTAEKWEVIQ